jgi:hypothetical protein
VEDNARRPSEEFKLVYRAAAADNLSVASCDCLIGESRKTIGSIGSNSEFHKYDDSSEFGSEQGSSGTRLRKRRSLTTLTRRNTSLVTPSRPQLTPPLANNRKKKQRSNFKGALSECLIRRLPIEVQSFPIVSGKQGVSKIANHHEALMLSHAASAPSVMNAVVSKSA